MNSNVIKFPTKAVRDWALVEKAIKDTMQLAGASPEMMTEVCGKMKEVWEKYNLKFTFNMLLPGNFPEELRTVIEDSLRNAVEELAKQIHEYSNQVLFDRLLLEVQLYKVRHGE